MRKVLYSENPAWEYRDFVPFYTALSADETKTVICIQQNREKTGSYTDGEPAYRLTWSVRAVTWPEGEVVASKNLTGGNPGYFKDGPGPGYGNSPSNELFEWLAQNITSQDVFFIGENVTAVTYSPDGARLIAGNGRRYNVTYSGSVFPAKIVVLDVATGDVLHTFNGHKDWIKDLVVSPDGKLLASSGQDATHFKYELRIWDLERGRPLYTIPGAAGPGGFAFLSDSQTLVVGTAPGLAFFDARSGQETGRLEEISGLYAAGDQLVDEELDPPSIQFFQLPGGELIRSLEATCLLGAQADGDTLAVCDGQGNILIIDARSGARLAAIPASGIPEVLDFRAGFIAAKDFENNTTVWDAASGAVVQAFGNSPLIVNDVAILPGGGAFAAGTDNGFVKLWTVSRP